MLSFCKIWESATNTRRTAYSLSRILFVAIWAPFYLQFQFHTEKGIAYFGLKKKTQHIAYLAKGAETNYQFFGP